MRQTEKNQAGEIQLYIGCTAICAQKSVCSASDGGWCEPVFAFPQALRDEDMKDIKALMMHDPHLVNGTVIKSNYLW